MSPERVIAGRMVYAPLICAACVFIGPGLHFVAFDGFRSGEVARNSATVGIPLAVAGVMVAMGWMFIMLYTHRSQFQRVARWGLMLSLFGGAVWGTVLLDNSSSAFEPGATAQDDNDKYPPLTLTDRGSTGEKHVLEIARRQVVVDTNKLKMHGLTMDDVRSMLDRCLVSVQTPNLRGVYSLTEDLGAIMLGVRHARPVYLGDVAKIHKL